VAAAQKAVAMGRPLYVPAGVCIVDEAALPSGLTMFGAGIGVTTFRRKPGALGSAAIPSLISFQARTTISLSQFSMDGNQAHAASGNANANLLLTNCAGFDVHGIECYGASGWGILVDVTRDSAATTHSQVTQCTCHNNALGIWVTGAYVLHHPFVDPLEHDLAAVGRGT
jgi:hypothetical protein